MTRVIIDEAIRGKLHQLADWLELCDRSGHVLGHFVPAAVVRSQYENIQLPIVGQVNVVIPKHY